MTMEIAIIGYEGCEYHMSAIETAHAAGIKAIVKTVPNPEEFQRFLMSIKATTHRTSPIVFDITATTASYFFLTPGGPGQVLYTTLFAESKAGTSKL